MIFRISHSQTLCYLLSVSPRSELERCWFGRVILRLFLFIMALLERGCWQLEVVARAEMTYFPDSLPVYVCKNKPSMSDDNHYVPSTTTKIAQKRTSYDFQEPFRGPFPISRQEGLSQYSHLLNYCNRCKVTFWSRHFVSFISVSPAQVDVDLYLSSAPFDTCTECAYCGMLFIWINPPALFEKFRAGAFFPSCQTLFIICVLKEIKSLVISCFLTVFL